MYHLSALFSEPNGKNSDTRRHLWCGESLTVSISTPVQQLDRFSLGIKINKCASQAIAFASERVGPVHVGQHSSAMCPSLLWVYVKAAVCGTCMCASSLLVWTAGRIYREIRGLPLAQWAPLVLGLSLSRQAGGLLSKQLFHSARVTGRPANCRESGRTKGRTEGRGGHMGNA